MGRNQESTNVRDTWINLVLDCGGKRITCTKYGKEGTCTKITNITRSLMRQGTNNEETERRFSTIGFSKSKWPIETKPRISKQTNRK